MALLDDIVNGGDLGTGLAVGAGALILWPVIRTIARPIAKSLIKGGLIAYQAAEQLYNGTIEGVSEIAREAQQEIGATTPTRGPGGGSSSRAT